MRHTVDVLIIECVEPGTAMADEIIRDYLREVASRYYGRPATLAELEQAVLDEPSDDLRDGTGTFLLALDDGRPIACAGARFVEDVGEVTKVFTAASHRGRGAAAQLLENLERVCNEKGLTALRLDTRAELTEACALYERLGFRRVPAFNNEPYSDRWYEKQLTSSNAGRQE